MEGGGGRLDQRGSDTLARVHERLATCVADAGLRGRFKQDIRVVDGAHVEHGRGAAEQKLGDAESRRGAQRGRVVRGLERPDAFAQPGQQAVLFGQPPEEGLAQMDVRLDQAGDDDQSVSVDRALRGLASAGFGQLGDTAVGADKKVGHNYRAQRVHADQRAAA